MKTLYAVFLVLLLGSAAGFGPLMGGAQAPGSESTSASPVPAPEFASFGEALRYAQRNNFTTMVAILRDGTVSRAEYAAAFDANTSCLKRAGYSFTGEPTWDAANRQLEIASTPPAAPTPAQRAAEVTCANQFEFISATFQQGGPDTGR